MVGSTSRQLRFDQVRQLTRLVGQAGELPVDGGVRRQHTLAGLARILGSPAALALTSTPSRVMSDVVVTGVDPVNRPAFEALETRCAVNPAVDKMYGRLMSTPVRSLVVASDQELVDARSWRRSSYVVDYLWRSGLDHMMIPARLLRNDGFGHCGGFFRCRGDRPFDDRDRNLLELFVLEHSKLLWPKDDEAALSPRLRETLRLLLDGQSAKEIAATLGLSVYTVNDYIKTLYKKLKVRSRGELFARVRKGRPPNFGE